MQPFPDRVTLMRGMPTDHELLADFLRERSDRAFRALYDRHAPSMFALAFRLMGRRDADAADVLQDAWTRAWRRLDAFRGESSLRTWLCGFVVNCCRERFREPLFEELPDRPASSRLDVALDLEQALALLSSGYRAVIVLHDVEGYTHREIAASLGIDEGTSKSQLSRGRAALRRALNATGRDHDRAR